MAKKKIKRGNFQNVCKTFCFAAVTPALLNVIKQHFHSKGACAVCIEACQKQVSTATRCKCGMSQA